MDLRDRIYKFLDENYPIDKSDDNLIDIRFDVDTRHVVNRVFGTYDINFIDWVQSRCHQIYGTKIHSGYKCWRNMNGEYHRSGNKPAIIYVDGHVEYFIYGKLIIN